MFVFVYQYLVNSIGKRLKTLLMTNKKSDMLFRGGRQTRVEWANELFSSMRRYLEKGKRHCQSYSSCICAFGWHQNRWCWM